MTPIFSGMTEQKKAAGIELKEAKEIPYELIEEFIHGAEGAGGEYVGKIRNAEVKLGAFSEGKLIGFMIGNVLKADNSFWIDAPYVKKEFRGREIGSRMLLKMINQAQKKGFTRGF